MRGFSGMRSSTPSMYITTHDTRNKGSNHQWNKLGDGESEEKTGKAKEKVI